MATSGRVKGWRDLLASNNIVPVAFDRQNAESEISTPFNLNIKLIDGLIPQNESSVTEYQVQVTLYDVAYKQFFGRTWVGPTMAVKPQSQAFKLPYEQHVYFHTSLNDPSIAVMLEIVAITRASSEEPRQKVSCGWGIFHLFRYKGDMPDTSNSAALPAQRMDVFHGSPRMLFYLDEPILDNPMLTKVNGCQLVYNIRTHHLLQRVMHLMPENTLIGANDILPGIVENFRSGKTPGLVDNLKKPRLLKPVSCYLERISISLTPNAEQFEYELCRIMNEERITQEALRPDGRRLEIIKRYLQIGVHNGWSYVAEPEIVQLTVDSTDSKGTSNASFRRGSISRRSNQRMSASGLLTSVNKSSVLVHKSRTHLEGMVEDPMFTIVFMLIYELGEPRVTTDRTTSMSRSSFSVIVRWAAFSPLANFDGPDHTIELVGGPVHNPENMLVFYCQSDETIASSANLAGLTGGHLNFSFSSTKMGQINHLEAPVAEMSMPMSVVSETVQRVTNAELYAQPTSQKPPRHHSIAEAAIQVSKSPRPSGQAVYPNQPMGYHVPPANAPQGYVPIAIQHMSDSAAVSPPATARTSSDLHELPFTPTHIPIMPAAPGLHSGIGLPRSAYAKLAAAGFPHILDRNGEPPEVIDPGDPMDVEMGREERDRLPANEIILQFLAFSRMQMFEMEAGVKQPATVFFSFQFYRFPQVTSERLLLGDVEGELSCNPSALPCILQRLDKDGSLMKGPPGYQVKYHVDPAFLKPGEGRLFLEHLSEQILHIDIWDGDSLMLIGSSTVELKHLCRQGLEAIQLTYELDVLINEYSQDESVLPSGGISRDGTFCPPEAKPLLKGRLHLRMANIGYPSEGKHIKTGAVSVKPTVIVKNDIDSSHFIGGGLTGPNGHFTALHKSHSNVAKHLVETNYEVASLLSSRKDKFNTGKVEGNAERKRKLIRMQKIRQLESSENMPVLTSFRKQKEERARDLKTIELYRDQSKNEGILSMLAQAITTKHFIHPSLGTAQFFEYILKNPYNMEHTIVIECDDPELIVITDPREWRHFRMLNEVYASIEEGMFNMDTPSGKPEIFLRPKESVNVPFKFLTFKADDRVQPQEPLDTHKQKSRQGFVPKKETGALQSRMSKVYFNTRDKKPIAILAVSIEPQPHVINQTFRFHHPEQSFLKKSIRFMQTQHLPGMPIPVTDQSGLRQIYIRCSDSNVICNSRSVGPGEPHDIFLKVACGASPQIKRFYIAVYLDPYLSKPVQIWQFYVHALQRVDMACTEGETTQFTLVVRGTQATRLMQCFSSHPNEMQLQPKEPFMLAANTVHEINMGLRPHRSGCKFLYVNVVDVESHQLLRTWLICATVKPPHIEKAFELELPIGGGRGCNKRISYTNPYPVRHVFHVHTNHPELLQFKDSRLELEGGETQSIGMKFAPYMNRGILEILVYINDDNDKTEETFCVKAVYK